MRPSIGLVLLVLVSCAVFRPAQTPVQKSKSSTRRAKSVAVRQEPKSERNSGATPTEIKTEQDGDRCVVGVVYAQGEMVVPVKNAIVEFYRESELLDSTRTDVKGKFAWCANPRQTEENASITVKVSKEPFETAVRTRQWMVGVQEDFDFVLNAPDLSRIP